MNLVKQSASTTGVASAVVDSLGELRSLERMMYDNGQREAGIFLSQVKLIASKVQHGIVVEKSLYLNLLLAAQRIPKDGQGGKRA